MNTSYLKQFILSTFFAFSLLSSFAQPDPPDGCINVFVINPNFECTEDYVPVCGCDGMTYINECVALNYYGVTEWTDSICPADTAFTCIDLQGVDFGICATPLGVGLINGQCQQISGCSYIADGIDYSPFFYDDLNSCSTQCDPSFSCLDFTNLDFGDCATVLGAGIISGSCQEISGCSYMSGGVDYTDYFYQSIADCQAECETDNSDCFDFAAVDFGDCEQLLGIGVVNGDCQYISGCSYIVDSVNYSGYFFSELEACVFSCGSTSATCINDSLITAIGCGTDFTPVCGCDGVTYSNDCVAYNYYGVTQWTLGPCLPGDSMCLDLGNVDFGDCDLVLGFGLVNGNCQLISGCGYIVGDIDYSSYFYDDQLACETNCPLDTTCLDLANVDFGICNFNLGYGYLDGECQSISGCGYFINGVDYSNQFFATMMECESSCNGIDCVDPSQIDLSTECNTEYIPVCGCDGVTYANQCVAYEWYGITEWTDGACAPNDTTCFDLTGIDFGDCLTPLGVAMLDGSCQMISGCGYLVDGTDYSSYFYESLAACQALCAPETDCLDFAEVDFGLCDLYLGVGLIDGECQPIAGCGYLVDGVDYSGFFYSDMLSCLTNCITDFSCIDSTLINPDINCPTVYEPVCGCDGVTYTNECIAVNTFGVSQWTYGECGTSAPEECDDLANIDLGDCDFNLGYALSDGECQVLYGCGYLAGGVDYSSLFFNSLADCETQCMTDSLCFDFAGLDFGTCDLVLGVGLVNGSCQYISGCSTEINGVDYASFFMETMEDCQLYCDTVTCFDANVIDPEYACTEEYDPVCGCNGITYSNSCVAYYLNGITEWTAGACASGDTLCFDLASIDFGDCTFPLGVGVINGTCQEINGCGYLVNNVDYSNYFYPNIDTCQFFCLDADNINQYLDIPYNVYPNPADLELTISFNIEVERTLQLKNELGQLVLEQNSNKKKCKIDVSNLEKGIYLLQVLEENKPSKVTKIVIN